MNITELEIENALRSAPSPKPRADLKQRLISDVSRQMGRAQSPVSPRGNGGVANSLRRWWPALIPAAGSLACAVGIGLQQAEIRDLKESIPAAPATLTAPEPSAVAPLATNAEASPSADKAGGAENEIARLRELVARLSSEVSGLELLRAENEKLRALIGRPSGEYLTPEEAGAMAKAKERAESIQCVNNLKQLGLAAKIWAVDNHELYPQNLIDMTNEMSTPKILHCPGDHDRLMATNFPSYTPANCSYEYLAPGSAYDEPQRVLFRCPIHGTITLADGSVQMNAAKNHPEQFVERDGKLYFENPASTPAPTPAVNGSKP